MRAPWAVVRAAAAAAAARRALVLVVAMSAIGGQALVVPARVSAEMCVASMPRKASYARGYLFTGVLEAKHAEDEHGPRGWEFTVERIYAGEGNVRPPREFEKGEPLILYEGCYSPRGLRVGGRYLVSIAALGSFDSQSTAVWEVLPRGRVRLVRQYGSKPVGTWRDTPTARRMDPRLLGPTKIRQAVRLMTPPGELPPTDTAPPAAGGRGDAPSEARAIETWLEGLLRAIGRAARAGGP